MSIGYIFAFCAEFVNTLRKPIHFIKLCNFEIDNDCVARIFYKLKKKENDGL